MSVMTLNRKTLSAVMVAVACVAGAGSAQAAVSAEVKLGSDLLFALSLIQTGASAAGTGVTYSAGSFLAPIASVALKSGSPSAAILTWGADASLTLANTAASAVFSGFVFDGSTNRITADIAFTSPTLTTTYNDVSFLLVTPTNGSLASVSTSTSPVQITLEGTAIFDLTAPPAVDDGKDYLVEVITALQVPSSVTSGLTGKQVATVSFSGTANLPPATAVPEPSTALSFLVGLGLMGGLLARRRAN
jgi:hypothetical protein